MVATILEQRDEHRTMDSPFLRMLGVELVELRQDWCVLELGFARGTATGAGLLRQR